MEKVNLETMVVGVDSSECSDGAVDWAAQEAVRTGRRLLLVNVWHWSSDVVSFGDTPDACAGGKRSLRRAYLRATSHGAVTSSRLVEGQAAAALTEIAKDAAMLVVGAHGRGWLGRTLIGSVSKGCVQHASCPVVVVPARVPNSEDQGCGGEPTTSHDTGEDAAWAVESASSLVSPSQ